MRLAIGRTNVIRPRFEDFRKEGASFAIFSIATFYFALHFTPPVYNKLISTGFGYLIIEFPEFKRATVNG